MPTMVHSRGIFWAAVVGTGSFTLIGCGSGETKTEPEAVTTSLRISTNAPSVAPQTKMPYPVQVSENVSAQVRALEVLQNKLFAVMSVQPRNAAKMLKVFQWDDQVWAEVGSPFPHEDVTDLFVFDDRMYGRSWVNNAWSMWSFDGQSWEVAPQMAPAFGSRFSQCAVLDGKLYAFGINEAAIGGNSTPSFINVFDGSAWTAQTPHVFHEQARVAAYNDNIFVVGGCHVKEHGDPCTPTFGHNSTENVIKFDGNEWSSTSLFIDDSTASIDDRDELLGVDPILVPHDGKLYAMGGWTGWDDDWFRSGVQVFDGQEWKSAPAVPLFDSWLSAVSWKGSIVALANSVKYRDRTPSTLLFDGDAWTFGDSMVDLMV